MEILIYLGIAFAVLVSILVLRTSIHAIRKWRRLQELDHANTVLPLIAVLQDPREEREVKYHVVKALAKIKDEQAIPCLIEILGRSDEAMNQLVADALTGFGEKVLEPIIKTLSSSKLENQRFWGIYLLGQIKNKHAIPALMVALNDRVAKIRSEAAKGLGNIQAHEAVFPLYQILLNDPDPLVRDVAAESLGVIADDQSLEALVAGLSDHDIETRRLSMKALEKMGKKAVPFILQALENGTHETQLQAALALERMGFVAEEIEELDGPKEKLAFKMLSLVAGVGVVDFLSRSLKHPNLNTRISLGRILGEIPHQKTSKALIEMAQNDSEWAGRLEAFSVLIKLADVESCPILIEALQHEEEMVRECLLTTLKDAPLSFLEKLWKSISVLLHDENVSIRIRAAEVLSRLSIPALAPIFLDSLSDAVWEVRKIAAESLGRLSSEVADKAVNPLIAALDDPSIEVRVAAVKSLGLIKNFQAIEPLARSFEWADENSRNDIAIALTATSKDLSEFTDLLMGLSNPKARAGVVWTLGLMGDEKSIPLITQFFHDREPSVRAVAAAALGRFGSFSTMVRFALMEGLRDPNEWVRASIVSVLGQHGDPSLMGHLIAMLDSESDELVCQNIVLALGCLGDVNIKKQVTSLHRIKTWLEKSSSEKNQAAGYIALALLRDEESFQQIFSAIQRPSLHLLIEETLRGLSKPIQDRFFSFLALDPQHFWTYQEQKSCEQYKEMLRSSYVVGQRINAIKALALIKEKSAILLIESAFKKDPNPQVRGAALAALEVLLDSHEMMNKIGEAASDPSIEVRLRILSVLRHLNPKDVEGSREKLIPLLDSPEEEIRGPVSSLLARLYQKDWRLLADQLMGVDNKFRIMGLIETLSKIGDTVASQFFLQFIKHRNSEVRSVSADLALRLGVLSRIDWIECLMDPQKSVRLSAVCALAKSLDRETVEIFYSLMEDPSLKVRLEIARSLGKQKTSEEELQVKILKHLSHDVNPVVQIMSLLSLYRLGEKGLVKDISILVSNLVKSEWEFLLLDLKKDGFFTELISILQHSHDVTHRKEALELLASLDLAHYAQELVVFLQDPASEVRLAAVEVLGQCKVPSIQQAIDSLSQDPVEAVRMAIKTRNTNMESVR